MFILDTDTLSLLWHGNETVADRVRMVGEQISVPLFISRITYLEAVDGRIRHVFTADGPTNLQKAIRRFFETINQLNTLQILEFSDQAYEIFGKLKANTKLRKLGPKDIQIASIVLACDNAILVTRNVKHFALVPGLKVENWAD